MLDNIRTHIEEGDLLAAMNELGAHLTSQSGQRDELTLLKGRTTRTERDYKSGLITLADRSSELARISAALLDLVGQIEKATCAAPTAPLPTAVSTAQLEQLLLSMFGADELRNFLASDLRTAPLTPALPGPTVSQAELAHQAVTLLARHGLIDAALRNRLIEARPGRAHEIRALLIKTTTESGNPFARRMAPP